jgi:uncharacterized membrane protein YdjX (TVP38/TMEM64 family)
LAIVHPPTDQLTPTPPEADSRVKAAHTDDPSAARACWKCRFDRDGLDTETKCPECGVLPSEGPPETLGTIARKLGPFSFLAGFATFMPAVAGIVLLGNLDPVGNWLRAHDALGLAIYIAAFMILGGLAFLPTYSQAVLGGWAFGLWAGFPAAMAGFFGGSLIGYGVAHVMGGDRGYRLINEHPKWKAVRDALVGGEVGAGFIRTTLIIALLRLPPNSPFALTNLVMAAAKVPRLPFAIGTLIGMTPRTIAAVYIATLIRGGLTKDAIKEATPTWMIVVGIASAIVALGIIGWIANKAVHKVTGMSRERAPAGSRG